MIEQIDAKMTESIMTIPKSILFNSLKDAIATKEDNRISDLTDLLYTNFELHAVHAAQGGDNSRRIDLQHQEIQNSLEMMREGFKSMEKRFEAVDRRFEAVGKRFDDLIHYMYKRFSVLTWMIGISFVTINSIMLLIKFAP